MSIVVTTPTGHVGSRVVRSLIQAGVRPTVIARNPDRLDPETRSLVEVRQGDQNDGDFIVEATKGAEALFWLDATDYPSEDPIAGTANRGENAARAIRENRIGHTVLVSSVGAEKRKGVGFIDGLGRVEEILAGSGGNVLFLRCGYFFTNLLMDLETLKQGVLPVNLPVDLRMPWQVPRDIGDVAAARLLARNWTGVQKQGVHGPEDLSHADVARIVGEALGREVHAVEASDDDARAALRQSGLPEPAVEGFVQMSIGLRENFTPEIPRSLLTTTPTTLRAWAAENLAGA